MNHKFHQHLKQDPKDQQELQVLRVNEVRQAHMETKAHKEPLAIKD